MNDGGSRKSGFFELVRYFGFTIIAVVVLFADFLIVSESISAEIHKSTFQILEDSAQRQRTEFQRFFDLVATRTALIAQHETQTGPREMVALLREELRDSAYSIQTGFANLEGDLFDSDQPGTNVSGEAWFQQSRSQTTTQFFLVPRDTEGGVQTDVIVSAPAYSQDEVSGVLFVTIDGNEIANKIETLAYDEKAVSAICDSGGKVLFCESHLIGMLEGGSVFDYTKQVSMQKGQSALGLAAALKRGETASFSYRYGDMTYYAVTTSLELLDWRMITIVSSETADAASRQVNVYLIGMLVIMLTVGISMAAQAYVHERFAVRKLEEDKDLLQQSTQRYLLITRLSKEVMFHVDMDSGTITFNDCFEEMFGFAPPNCSIHNIEKCLPLFVKEDQQRFIHMMNRLRAGGEEANEELRMVNSRGAARWKRLEIFSVFDQNGQSAQLVGKIVDIQRQKQSMQRLIRQADGEPLTGLLNRAAMERNVSSFLSGEGLYGKHALLMMDFDNFKAVNDTLGHAKGDDLLVSFAAVIRRVFRAGDYSSRIGGDEYMVFVKDIDEESTALDKAETLRGEMTELSRKIGVPVSVSIGISLYAQDGKTFERLYQSADEALYHVKNHGKNSAVFFSALGKPKAESDR